MDICLRAAFLNYILLNFEEYLLEMPYPDIIGIWQRVMDDSCPKSHLICARALYNFFYDSKPKKDDINGKRDYDYVPIGEHETCRTQISQINKSIAHLTLRKGTHIPWGRAVVIRLEALLVPEIHNFLNYILQDADLEHWLNQFTENNYKSRILRLPKKLCKPPLSDRIKQRRFF